MNSQMSDIPMAEQLRSLDQMHAPDARNDAGPGREGDGLAEHHAAVARLFLSDKVPAQISIQFETARNLYLYAWHVYRFYPVAEMQVLTTLESGLRDRLPVRLPQTYQRTTSKQPSLHGLLNYAIDQGLVRNEGFRRWHLAADQQARQRLDIERLKQMVEHDLDSIEFDADELVEVLPQDRQWDLVGVLRQSLHRRRNLHAHGNGGLSRQALGTIELVAEILNQLFGSNQRGEDAGSRSTNSAG